MKIFFSDHKRLYKKVFGDDDGKKILHELADKFYVTKPTIRKGDNQEDFLIREGMRQVVLYIMTQTEYDIEEYLKNMKTYKMEIQHDRTD